MPVESDPQKSVFVLVQDKSEVPLCVFVRRVSDAGTPCAVGARGSLGRRTPMGRWGSPNRSGHGFPGLWTVQSHLYILHLVFSAFSKHRYTTAEKVHGNSLTYERSAGI